MIKEIFTETRLQRVSNALKQLGKRIVFTNGCFDLLHVGHLDLLQRSREYGDILIVGMNSDQSVKQLKGEHRPIICEEARKKMLCGLECVNYVYVFNDQTAHRAIQLVRPHFYTKSGFSNKEEIPEYWMAKSCGAEVIVITQVYDISTSQIREKIKNDIR